MPTGGREWEVSWPPEGLGKEHELKMPGTVQGLGSGQVSLILDLPGRISGLFSSVVMGIMSFVSSFEMVRVLSGNQHPLGKPFFFIPAGRQSDRDEQVVACPGDPHRCPERSS